MTRGEIVKAYKVSQKGVITSPGKFYGEMIYAPYFWDMLMHGYCDGEEEGVASFNLTPEDLAQFPELEGFKIITYQEDDRGFACCDAE